METEKKMNESLSLTYEGLAEFGFGSIYLTSNDPDNLVCDLASVVNAAICPEKSKSAKMRVRINLTIDRIPDDKLEVEVK